MLRLITIVLVVISCSVLHAQEDWVLSSDGKDIKTYYRESAESDIKELKIITSIEAPAILVFELLNDIDLYDDWVYRTSEAKLVQYYNKRSLQYYAVVDFPWPFDDREMYIKSSYTISPDQKSISTNSMAVPRKDIESRADHVRITDMVLGWDLEEDEQGVTHVTYVLRSDPGGSIPAWMVNLALEAGPTQTMNNLRDLVYNHLETETVAK
jgi:hypothetical protein